MLMATAIPVNASPILRKVSSLAHRLSAYHIGALSRRYQGIAFSGGAGIVSGLLRVQL